MMLNRRSPSTFAALTALLLTLGVGAPATAAITPVITTDAPAQVSATHHDTTMPGRHWRHARASWDYPTRARVSRITGLRYASHPGFDRVVIDVRGPIPDWSTHYARAFHYEGSGHRVPIRGRSGLVLNLGGDAHNRAGHNLYTGPRIARPGYTILKALAFTGDFEGQVSFAFALRHRAPYRVFSLRDPQRLVLDFKK